MTATLLDGVPKRRNYGFKPGLPGVLSDPADTDGLTVLDEVDPRHELPPIVDQGQLGSCTANATACVFEYDAKLDGDHIGPLSRLLIYYGERQIEGTLGQGDTGAYGHDAFIFAAKHGVCRESDWPYDISQFEGPPPAKAIAREGYYKLRKRVKAPVQDEATIKSVLSNRQTIAVGFTVYSSFESPEVAQSGIVPMPKRGEEVLGGHEVVIVGYLKDHPHYFLMRNSWGTGWGIEGYFLMPVAYILNRSLTSDLRTIVRPLG